MNTTTIQHALKAASPFIPGTDPGAIDGIRGKNTEAAARNAINTLCDWLENKPTRHGFILSDRSESNLKGVHGDLTRVVRRAATLSAVPFVVIEGLRTKKRQKELVAKGASKTMNSRPLTGHAADLMADIPGDNWNPKHYVEIARAMKEAAEKEDVPIEWGGDWKRFNDSPHFQLPRKLYA